MDFFIGVLGVVVIDDVLWCADIVKEYVELFLKYCIL